MKTQQYAVITGSYWAFTLTDGALRMLVVLFFHGLGYSPLDIALLFLFYEFFGIVTNLAGGWLAARIGLAVTVVGGLFLQVAALGMLLVDVSYFTVGYVMAAQALSGIAKDLNKTAAKSSVKLVSGDSESRLYRWVAWLTGSKNALKGVGYFAGSAGLGLIGFTASIATMAIGLCVVGLISLVALDKSMGRASFKPKFADLLSKSRRINLLAAARLFLFSSRDVWFVVALPVFLQLEQGWSAVAVGSFLAAWIIGYGVAQALSPKVTGLLKPEVPDGRSALRWALALAVIPSAMAVGLYTGVNPEVVLIPGLMLFAVVFAMNSAIHSFLVVSYANSDGVSLDVGFYYMANAAGRLLGAVCSGSIYQAYGLSVCLALSAVFIGCVLVISHALPQGHGNPSMTAD